MGRHSRGDVGRRGKQALAIAAAAGSEGLGICLITWGNHRAAQDYYYNVEPWGAWGAFFVALPVIALAIVVIAAIAKAAAAEHRRYREWKASLPPEQRAAVELAEAAAAAAAAIAMWEHHKRVDARLSASVMGRAPLNNVQAGVMNASARIMARSQYGQQPPPPTGADPMTTDSQALIAWHHPEHLGPDGTYRSVPW